MKSVVSIFLICYFSLSALVPRMDLDRLTTIPALIGHYLDHEKSDGNYISITEFIDLHYGDKGEEPSDGHELPFQKHHCSVVSYVFATFLPDITGSLVINSSPTKFFDTCAFRFTTKHISDIWQPPRA